MSPLNILYINNEQLPSNDHRLAYGERSEICNITFALPGRPEALDAHRYVHFGLGEGVRISYLVNFLKLLLYLIRNRNRLDLVHYNSTLLTLFGPLLSSCVGIPSIVTVTGFGRTFSNQGFKFELLRRVYMALMSISARCARRVLFQNRGDLEYLAQQIPAASRKIMYVGSAISMPVIRHKDFRAPKLQVLLVTRLLPDKGIKDFLDTAEALQGQPFEFVLVGPAATGFEELLAQVKVAHQKGIIVYKGVLDSKAILDQFAEAHVFYFPSRYGEGLARVMLESGCGLLCPIANDIPANRDLTDEGRGFLVKGNNNTQQVIRILERLAEDRAALEQNANAYQEFILRHYNIETFVRRMDNILIDLAREITAQPEVTKGLSKHY